MPFYEYVCEACGKDFVLLQSMNTREQDTVCPYCSEKRSKKMLSTFASKGGDHSVCGVGSGGWGGG